MNIIQKSAMFIIFIIMFIIFMMVLYPIAFGILHDRPDVFKTFGLPILIALFIGAVLGSIAVAYTFVNR